LVRNTAEGPRLDKAAGGGNSTASGYQSSYGIDAPKSILFDYYQFDMVGVEGHLYQHKRVGCNTIVSGFEFINMIDCAYGCLLQYVLTMDYPLDELCNPY
jgi:hypothetical protein